MIWPTILKHIKHHDFSWNYMFPSKHAANLIEVYCDLGKYREDSHNPYWGLAGWLVRSALDLRECNVSSASEHIGLNVMSNFKDLVLIFFLNIKVLIILIVSP